MLPAQVAHLASLWIGSSVIVGLLMTLQTYTLTLASSSHNTSAPIELDDLQLDFTMLDPHVRLALPAVRSDATSTTYEATFRAPDRHGVFKFVVEYWRPG